MSYIEPQLFIIGNNRSWPFKTSSITPAVKNYGRKITNVTFSGDDDSDLSFTETGETAEIIGLPAAPGTIVLCVRLNATWVIVQTCFATNELRALDEPTDDDEPEAAVYSDDYSTVINVVEVPQDQSDYYPYTIELITTGDNKSDLDGLYQLYSRYNGKQQRRDHISYGRVKTNLARTTGAEMVLSFVGTYDSGEVVKTYTLTVTHSAITTTVYEGTGAQLTKQSGDASLPDDVWLYVNLEANMPLWFDIDQGCPLDGLYTLWPDYITDSTDTEFAESTGYFHQTDGTRSTLAYHMEYNASSDVFTIDGGDFSYTCDLADFSLQNGDRFTFTRSADTTGYGLPETLQVRRPATAYTRNIKLSEQA
ncbi:hypothetical protein CA11_33270 [Gimesia maris]|uniref:hypothetical protein n=1 Tax=Gimesia maris TaxID=122 RepID=UPI001188C490|nr:hypothetical protein [Gimesia maris]QDU15502.1 hypothetical protein CA11_33270 [Gimesia maris]